uniref:Uncharacterized protein n=1 Tax=Arundo donax TaxID=35708 RepID=A0A0A9AMP5_ARUDO
MLTICLRKVL